MFFYEFLKNMFHYASFGSLIWATHIAPRHRLIRPKIQGFPHQNILATYQNHRLPLPLVFR
jgi:hypothetical protein